MKSYLQDVVAHTSALGIIELVKITGTDTATLLDAMAEDRSVIVKATALKPLKEFSGVFGMPNLSKLNVLLNIPEYKDGAKIKVTTQTRNGEEVPSGLHFENKQGNFKNDYRFMSTEVVNDKLKSVTFKGAKWNVEFEPTAQNIQRLKFMIQANSEETTFVAKTDENGNLVFFFGDHSSHAGEFVFHEHTKGTLSKGFLWPIAVFNSILNLPGDKSVKFSDDGVAQIIVNSGVATYEYLLPATQK